jgi:hypothetical protein
VKRWTACPLPLLHQSLLRRTTRSTRTEGSTRMITSLPHRTATVPSCMRRQPVETERSHGRPRPSKRNALRRRRNAVVHRRRVTRQRHSVLLCLRRARPVTSTHLRACRTWRRDDRRSRAVRLRVLICHSMVKYRHRGPHQGKLGPGIRHRVPNLTTRNHNTAQTM